MKNDKLLDTIRELSDLGFDLDGLLDDCSIVPLYRIVDSCHKRTRVMAIAAYLLAKQMQPLTLRGLFYQMVPDVIENNQKQYKRLGKLLTRLRRAKMFPMDWLVDGLRRSVQTNSWSGLADYTQTVSESYRKDFWASLSEYCCVFLEKDDMSGVLQPVLDEFDVVLHTIRGYSSIAYTHSIAKTWVGIDKPINIFYFGDFDPSGLDMEVKLRQDLLDFVNELGGLKHRGKWIRLGITALQMERYEVSPVPVKSADSRAKKFVQAYGATGSELDALKPTVIRQLLTDAITGLIPSGEWERLKRNESLEKEAFRSYMSAFESSVHLEV